MRNPMSPAAARTTASLCFTIAALVACTTYSGPPPGPPPEPAPGYASVTVITAPPPDLPVYEQPVCPADGYVWTPGYWAWADGGYYWVPGTWVEAPQPGYLWTPGYWGWGGNAYVYHQGYWGERVGYYGGVNYGYGYPGHGYEGGRWDHGHYYYNQSVNNVNVTVVHNVYNTTVINNTRNVTRVSYNGGNGGIQERETAEEESAGRGPHMAPVPAQMHHVEAARSDPQLRVATNLGKPPIAATPRAGAFTEAGVVPAREGGAVHSGPPQPDNGVHNGPPQQQNAVARPNNAVHAAELPPVAQPAPPNTGDQRRDQKFQQDQQKLVSQQTQERQQLQQKQDQDHQRLTQRGADPAAMQKVEQQHTQQTQQLSQKHSQQMQKLQAKEQPHHDQGNQNKP